MLASKTKVNWYNVGWLIAAIAVGIVIGTLISNKLEDSNLLSTVGNDNTL